MTIPTTNPMTLPLALTLGEPAGIGPDITLAAWLARHDLNLPPFYVIGDIDLLQARAKLLNLDVALERSSPDQAIAHFDQALPVVDCRLRTDAQPGKPDKSSAPIVIETIRHAVRDVMAGHARAIVTNPIAKSVLYDSGFAHPGHTEFLAALASETQAKSFTPVMMLWSETLSVVPVTIHLPLRDAIAALTPERIVQTCRILAHDLRTRFGIAQPRIAISGLNPHAGEGGAMGDEEASIIAPAIATLRAEGLHINGPLPADTMFHPNARATYDCAVCMYHDQALIPIKTIAFDDAVNVTLGLPFVRTSPDHGTAVNIAGTGRAKPDSLIAALRLAARLGS